MAEVAPWNQGDQVVTTEDFKGITERLDKILGGNN